MLIDLSEIKKVKQFAWVFTYFKLCVAVKKKVLFIVVCVFKRN